MDSKPIVKKYEKLEDFDRTCPKCLRSLNYEEGLWYCDSCQYEEENNIIECRECFSLFIGNCKEDFGEYCNVPAVEGGTCRGYARSEAEQDAYEDMKIREHIKNCTNPECECRNY